MRANGIVYNICEHMLEVLKAHLLIVFCCTMCEVGAEYFLRIDSSDPSFLLFPILVRFSNYIHNCFQFMLYISIFSLSLTLCTSDYSFFKLDFHHVWFALRFAIREVCNFHILHSNIFDKNKAYNKFTIERQN